MSLLNVYRTDDHALVVVDSAGLAIDDGTIWACSKMWPIVHADAILAARGSLLVAQSVASLAGMVPGSVDELADALPVICQRAHQHAVPQASQPHIDAIAAARAGLQEIVLLGHSPRLGRVHGLYAHCPAGGTDWSVDPIRDWLLAPGTPSAAEAEPSDEAGMLELARAQKREAPETIGGVLRLATVKRGAIDLRRIGELS